MREPSETRLKEVRFLPMPLMTTTNETIECLDDHGENTCEGDVEYHSVDPGRAAAFPRCDYHWGERLMRRENSIERYENSDVAPSWFDPADAGERWDDDY